MVTIRPTAEFHTKLDYDLVVEDGEVVQFGGRTVIEAIGGMLSDLGYKISDPIYADEHGWEMDVHSPVGRFWLQVTRLDASECILCTDYLVWGLWVRRRNLAAFLTELDAALRQDGRFDQIVWFRNGNDPKRSLHPVTVD